MNDMQKPTSGSARIDTLIAKQENARKVRELKQRNPSGPLEEIPAVRIVNALPNIADGQVNTLTLAEVMTGNITVELTEWPNMDAAYWLWFRLGTEEDWGVEHEVQIGFGSAEFVLPLGNAAFVHGVNSVLYYVKSQDDVNEKYGAPGVFFVDLRDPNGGQQPDKPILPADMTGNVVSPEYLDQHGGVTFTLPTPLDSKPEDTYCFYVNGTEITTDQPAAAPFEVTISAAFFNGLLEGDYELTYTLKDRAGNESVESFDTLIRVVKTSVPVLQLPLIPEGPAISLDDARDGVWVECDYDPQKPGDIVTVIWQGERVESVLYPENSVLVPFDVVARPGEEYAGKVKYELNQDKIIHESGEVDVDVDLTLIGPPNPEGPDNVINPDLELLTLESSTQEVDAIVPADKGQPATITVPLYDNAKEGDMIAIYYGSLDGLVGNPVGLTAQNVTDGEVSVPLLWPQISAIGNGNIPAFYRIYPEDKPENSQQSLDTIIVVTVANMEDLPLATFPDADPLVNVINCSDQPWIRGVNVRLSYPSFEVGDMVTVHWVLDETYTTPGETEPPTDAPLEETRKDFPDRVDVADVAAGYIDVNVPWGLWLSALIRGSIVVSWTLFRDENTSGTSDLSFVRYSLLLAGGGTCRPD